MDMINIRASSLADLFDCPARWSAKHIDGLRMPSSPAARLGTAVHAGTAVFDSSRLSGGSPVTAEDAASAVVDALHKPDEEVDWEDSSPDQIEPIALALHNKYCSEIAPTQNYCGVEVTCEKLELTDIGISLTGTTDRVRETVTGEIGICDLKTGARAVDASGKVSIKGHALQLGVYELLAENALGKPITAPAQIIGLNTGKTEVAQRVGIADISNSKSVLIGTDDHLGLLEMAGKLIHSGAFYGNNKSVLCNPKYCPAYSSCRFRA